MAVERKVRKISLNRYNKELEISDCFETNPTHPCPCSEYVEHHRVWPGQKKVYNKVKRTYSAKCAKLAQNRYNKELEISDCFETKPTHPCPSLEYGERHRVWPRQKKVHNKVKGRTLQSAQNLRKTRITRNSRFRIALKRNERIHALPWSVRSTRGVASSKESAQQCQMAVERKVRKIS